MLAEWSYHSSNVEDSITNLKFSADWGACGECSRLIEEEDMKGLVERATSSYMANNPEERRDVVAVRNHVYQLYVLFYHHRKGPRTAFI
jgi:hypothetical protein